jgi:hypothetical protein
MSDENLGNDRLGPYRVTADASVRTCEVLLAASPEAAAEIHRQVCEYVCSEVGAELTDFELGEIDDLGNGRGDRDDPADNGDHGGRE